MWSSTTAAVLGCIKDSFLHSITGLAICSDTSKIAVMNLDDNQTISIYLWKSQLLLSRVYGGSVRLMGICFSPNGQEILTCGMDHVCVWDVSRKAVVRKFAALDYDTASLQLFLCCCYFNNQIIVSTQSGHVNVFSTDAILDKVVRVHDGAVSAMHVSRCGTLLVTGGVDGAVRIWGSSLECLHECNLHQIYPVSECTRVISVAISEDLSKIAIGTRGCEIFVIENQCWFNVLLSGHHSSHLRCVVTHPVQYECATAGDDCSIRIWDTKSHILKQNISVDAPVRALAYSSDGNTFCAGFGEGNFPLRVIYDSTDKNTPNTPKWEIKSA